MVERGRAGQAVGAATSTRLPAGLATPLPATPHHLVAQQQAARRSSHVGTLLDSRAPHQIFSAGKCNAQYTAQTSQQACPPAPGPRAGTGRQSAAPSWPCRCPGRCSGCRGRGAPATPPAAGPLLVGPRCGAPPPQSCSTGALPAAPAGFAVAGVRRGGSRAQHRQEAPRAARCF